MKTVIGKICLLVGFVCLVCAVNSPELLAQQLRISGTVSDGSGGIPDASVSLRDPVGVTKDLKTNSTGQYSFDALRTGTYEITVSREGFAPTTRALTLGTESRTVNLTLQLSGLYTTVDVNDTAGRATASGMDNVSNREVPNYVVTVRADVLQEQGVNDLASALENISGAMSQVQYGAYDWFTIGGIPQQSGNDFVYVDGMTLTGNRTTTQMNNIEEVQVFKGPNSILYQGSGAGQGGMVNLVRKKPQSTPTQDIQYRVGGWGLHEVAGGSAGQFLSFEKLLYRVDVAYSHRDGWRQSAAHRFNASPSVTYLINSKMRISATEGLTRDRFTLDAGVPMAVLNRPDLPFDRKFNPPSDFQLSRDWQNKLDFTWNLHERLTLSHTFFSRRNRDQYLDAESLTYQAATDQINRGAFYYQHNRRPVQDLTDLTGDFTVFGTRHRVLARYEYSDQDNYSDRTGPTPGTNNSAAVIVYTPVPVQPFIDGTWVEDATTYTNFPVMRKDYSSTNYHRIVFQDQFNPVEWIGINFAMNRSKYRRETHNDGYDNGTQISTGNDATTRFNTKSNYRAGIALIPLEGWPVLIRAFQPYFSYNTSFNPTNSVQPDGTPLNPTINESFEVGNKWLGLNNRLSILTAYRLILDKNRTLSLPGGWFEQIGTSKVHNADLDIQGELGWGVSLLANYGYSNSRIGDDRNSLGTVQSNAGRQFPHSPKHMSRVWLSKRFNVGQSTIVRVSLGGRYVYRYYTSSANTPTGVVPVRSTMDGAVNVQRGRYEIGVNFENMTDKDRYFVSQWAGNLYPGKPFNATMTVRYRFQ